MPLPECLYEAATFGVDPDSPDWIERSLAIVSAKKTLQAIYAGWYLEIRGLLDSYAGIRGRVLEIGSGSGFLHKYIPGLIRSEIMITRQVDVVSDAQALPFGDASLRGIVMVDVFHHIPDCSLFLSEATRCIKSGGAIVMIEPWLTIFSRFVYRFLHQEPCYLNRSDWSLFRGGPMTSANSALPWMVFYRDRRRFENEFKELRISLIRPHTPFSYLLSGGLTYKCLLPYRLFLLLRRIENRLGGSVKNTAMFASIVISRR